MNRPRPAHASRPGALVVLLFLAILGACSKDDPVSPLPQATVPADFALVDVNLNSSTANDTISPRAQLGKVSAWYFGHST